jgi:hypothetical protein
MYYVPSSFLLGASKFGLLVHRPCWLKLSSILTEDEALSLAQMTESSSGALIYRATNDGFNATKFHKQCNWNSKTVTIIKTNSNCIFGGYTAAIWSGERTEPKKHYDSNAFLFSVRKNGISNPKKFKIKNAKEAIIGNGNSGPIFGNHDIFIEDRSNFMRGSYTNFGNSYELPDGYTYGEENTKSYLAGSYNTWLVDEIEVYTVNTII